MKLRKGTADEGNNGLVSVAPIASGLRPSFIGILDSFFSVLYHPAYCTPLAYSCAEDDRARVQPRAAWRARLGQVHGSNLHRVFAFQGGGLRHAFHGRHLHSSEPRRARWLISF